MLTVKIAILAAVLVGLEGLVAMTGTSSKRAPRTSTI
jgi:hypothetical protein